MPRVRFRVAGAADIRVPIAASPESCFLTVRHASVLRTPGPAVNLIREVGHSKVYVIQNNSLRWVPSMTMLNTLGYIPSDEILVNHLPFDVGSPMTGPNNPASPNTPPSTSSYQFVRVSGSNNVYVDANGTYDLVSSAALFTAMGGHFPVAAQSSLPGPSGTPVTLIRQTGTNPVYIIQGNQLHWVPTLNTLHALGYHRSDEFLVNRLPLRIGSPEPQ